MKTEFKRDLQNNYLILEVPEADAEDGYGLRMAERNQVKGLLPMHESRRDGKLYLHYEITSRQTLESVYEKKVMGYQDILAILSGIRDTLEDMRKYLLSPQKILFAPEMMYMLPQKGGLQLCYYAKEDEYPIVMLAEFILKRLDHRDRQAVTLGYGFFQRANSVNFSLTETLKDILTGTLATETGKREAASPGDGRMNAAGVRGGSKRMRESGIVGYSGNGSPNAAMPDGRISRGNGVMQPCGGVPRGGGAMQPGSRMQGGSGVMQPGGGIPGGSGVMQPGSAAVRGESSVRPGYGTAWGGSSVRSGGGAVWGGPMPQNSGPVQNSRSGSIGEWDLNPKSSSVQEAAKYRCNIGSKDEDSISENHRERKREKNRPDLADRLFERVHPAVLLSFLTLMIGLELMFAFEILDLTGTGGCFFLILSVEILINRRILRKGKDDQKAPEWEDEENEDYERIMREVYQQEPAIKPEAIEETRYLDPEEEPEAQLCLVCTKTGTRPEDAQDLQDIHPGTEPLYIGKIKGEADVILHASTVSRMHARLQIREGVCYLKDMNSKNGTFVNGVRLIPQEEREIEEGDRVSFADMEYHVVKNIM